jgi:hypothetical protein
VILATRGGRTQGIQEADSAFPSGLRLTLTTGGLRKYKIAIEINRKLAVPTPSTP